MRIGTSLTLIAVGAVLAFAVHAHLQVISFFAVGVILMLVGAIGPLLTRANLTGRGVALARPSWTQIEESDPVDTADDVSGAVDDDADAGHPVPQARASDSAWSSPRSGLRAI